LSLKLDECKPLPGGEKDTPEGDRVVIRGMGSQAGVVGAGMDACNGIVYVVDTVLLPEDTVRC
jgi:uncharacterized surface protein with fasciclin (FAS1) repeats